MAPHVERDEHEAGRQQQPDLQAPALQHKLLDAAIRHHHGRHQRRQHQLRRDDAVNLRSFGVCLEASGAGLGRHARGQPAGRRPPDIPAAGTRTLRTKPQRSWLSSTSAPGYSGASTSPPLSPPKGAKNCAGGQTGVDEASGGARGGVRRALGRCCRLPTQCGEALPSRGGGAGGSSTERGGQGRGSAPSGCAAAARPGCVASTVRAKRPASAGRAAVCKHLVSCAHIPLARALAAC